MNDRIGDVISRWQQVPKAVKKKNLESNRYHWTQNEEERKAKARANSRKSRNKHYLACIMRSRLKYFLRRKGACKSRHTVEYLGCTWADYKKYIKAKFTPGMTWAMLMRGKIHIDHIIPVSLFGASEDELRRAFHYTNTQPLWAHDNHVKGASCPRGCQPDLFSPVLHSPSLRK